MLNLTQHNATPEQLAQGVIELTAEDKAVVKSFLTFNEIEDVNTAKERAESIAAIAAKYNVDKAMIGGAPYFMTTLEVALKQQSIEPNYAFTKRVVVETTTDGVTTKTAIFKHEGFIAV